MLKGFNYPLTPKGKSTLNPPPPWYYSADFLNIEFWSDPAAAAAVLPPGLDPDPAAQGHGNALFYDWQFTGANEEYWIRPVISIESYFCWLTPCLKASR
jgi:Acetoacetate decarboxylase (ADC)